MDCLNDVYSFPVEKMRLFSDYMHKQMIEGLAGRPSDLKMLPSFITSLATGIFGSSG